MTLSTFGALLLFSFASSITPGPNNIMLFASGLNFGLRRTLPHMVGISVGFGILLTAVGLGLGLVLERVPASLVAIKIIGGSYMVYLAWRIARSGPVEVGNGQSRPMTFLQAALFQWVNPKAWVMASAAMVAYTGEGNYAVNVALVVFAFCFVNFPSVSVWAGFGFIMRRFLENPVILRAFNVSMALVLVISLWPMLTT